MVRAGIRSTLLIFETRHLEHLRKEKASRCEIGWEKLSADQGSVSKDGQWSTRRYSSVQWSQHIRSRLVSLHICSHTLLPKPLWNRNSWYRWGISNNTCERNIFSGCRREEKDKMYDSPSISEELLWQFCLILTALAVVWHLCSGSPLCPCPGTMGSVYLALYERSINIQCVCKCRLLHALTTWSNSEQLLGHYLHEECVWVYHYAKGIRHTC